MSKLLQTLDLMVQDDHLNPFAFVEVDIEKVYIQQLLQV
jgi:integrator complex subunit 1